MNDIKVEQVQLTLQKNRHIKRYQHGICIRENSWINWTEWFWEDHAHCLPRSRGH